MNLEVDDFVVYNANQENDSIAFIAEVLPKGRYRLWFITGPEYGTSSIDEEQYVVAARRRFLELGTV